MEEQERQVEQQALTLFDLYWFHHQILRHRPPPLPLREMSQSRHHRRSLSDIAPNSAVSAVSARTVHHHKLETIVSGQEQAMKEEIEVRCSKGRMVGARSKRRGLSKSLSDLEFEELKGFMDLGFTFEGAAVEDPRMVAIVPGLQRLGRTAAEEEERGRDGVSRPYLSEAWEEEEEERRVREWKVPAAGEGVDMKDHIRVWAHVVASAVQ